MSQPRFGVVAVGNALVDVLSQTTDAFLQQQKEKNGMEKGAMTLIDEVRAVELYSLMGPGVESSGGSAANTMAGFASFGGKGAFIGKVAQDELGKIFQHDLRAQGISFETQPLIMGAHTGRCLILVTPDAQRTMNTFLGASIELNTDDVDEDVIADSGVTYLEGYLFDRERAKQAFIKASECAHKAGRQVALTLSDPFCVDRHRSDFLRLVENHVDILFANEEELKSLFMQQNFDDALSAISSHVKIAAVTRGAKGAIIRSQDQTHEIPAQSVARVIDTTGAGDQFAAGFLYGLTQNMPLEKCGYLGVCAAGEVIKHMGPRPQISFAELLSKAA